MAQETNTLVSLSQELAGVVERVAASVVRVDDGSRLTATGILWSDDGLVLSTSHGVERDEDVVVELASGARLPATMVGRDEESDLALLRVTATGLPAVTLADAGDVKVGGLVLALGRPGAGGLQATLGIISARLEAESEGKAEYILHTDATFYPGFSGGPLVNVGGQVVGLANLALGRGQGVALGAPVLRHVADALRAHGQVRRGYLGISTQAVALPEKLREALGLAAERGLLIVGVGAGSPAEGGGLLLGDTVLAAGGQAVEDADTLRRRLRAMQAGQPVTLSLLRGGQRQEVTVTLGAQE